MSVVLASVVAFGMAAAVMPSASGEPGPVGAAGLLGLAAGAVIAELVEHEAPPPHQEWRNPPVLARPSPDRDFLLDVFTTRPALAIGRSAR